MIANIEPDLIKCQGCVYLVDWHDFPETTGYSMAKQGENNWAGCMKMVAQINYPSREHICKLELLRERQLELF